MIGRIETVYPIMDSAAALELRETDHKWCGQSLYNRVCRISGALPIMKRILLLIATNFAVVLLLGVVLSILQSVFGIRLGENSVLLLFASIFGFGGAFVSLAISKWMAKRATGAQVITQPRNELEMWLLGTVRRQAEAAGIGMPEVAIYDAPEINAFATGMRRDASLVAVSTGLLRAMSRDEAEAVLAHEISHVANGDMVTMTLLQGVLNTFVIFFARLVGRAIDAWISGNRDGGPSFAYYIIVFVLDMIFGIVASVIVMAFSRWREFRADAGGARLAGRQKMIGALERLAQTYGVSTLPNEVRAFGISGGVGSGLKRLFMSHPPLAERIAALRNG
jgi:heat shock protein HtpX